MSKTKTLRPVRPNKGIEMQYRKKLMRLIDDMQKSVLYWTGAEYRKFEDEIIAQDALPSNALIREVRQRAAQWTKEFRSRAKDIANWFIKANYDYTYTSFRASLGGSSGDDDSFNRRNNKDTSEHMRDTLSAFIHENVSLIRSIPEKYFTEVEGVVMRSVINNRDLAQLTNDLQHRYSVTRNRAILIARDQNNKATEQINRTRQLDLGIRQGIWVHSAGVNEPRESHVRANGKVFDLDKGLLVDGEYIFPGEQINCHCTYRPIIQGFD